MMTQCPACGGSISSAAASCPKCGHPVAGQAPTAQPGFSPPPQPQGHPQQPGYPAGYGQPPKKSNFLRNCLICGCFLIVLATVAVVGVPVFIGMKMASSFVEGPAAAPIGQQVLPGTQFPAAYAPSAGVDLGFFGFKAKGVFYENKAEQMLIAFGAWSQKPEDRQQLRKQFAETVRKQKADSLEAEQSSEAQPDEEFTLGDGEKVQAAHTIVTEKGERQRQYMIILEPFAKNEFGWVGIFAQGPDKTFDLDGFKAFLGSIRKK